MEAGIELLKQGLDAFRQLGTLLFLPHKLALLVEAYGWANQFTQGLALLAEALAISEATGEHFWRAELYRLKGEFLLAQGSLESEACFQQALQLARQQNAKSLELHAVISLARLWQQQGRQADANAILAEIYSWFTEGFDTADLQAARALLHRISLMTIPQLR